MPEKFLPAFCKTGRIPDNFPAGSQPRRGYRRQFWHILPAPAWYTGCSRPVPPAPASFSLETATLHKWHNCPSLHTKVRCSISPAEGSQRKRSCCFPYLSRPEDWPLCLGSTAAPETCRLLPAWYRSGNWHPHGHKYPEIPSPQSKDPALFSAGSVPPESLPGNLPFLLKAA